MEHVWKNDPPPLDTIVWSKYYVNSNDWQLVRTCKYGCCVSTWFGSMILPVVWREATQDEQIEIQKEWDAIPQINMSDLY